METWDDLGHRSMSKEERQQAKSDYRKLMKQFKKKSTKPKSERQVVIEQGRF